MKTIIKMKTILLISATFLCGAVHGEAFDVVYPASKCTVSPADTDAADVRVTASAITNLDNAKIKVFCPIDYDRNSSLRNLWVRVYRYDDNPTVKCYLVENSMYGDTLSTVSASGSGYFEQSVSLPVNGLVTSGYFSLYCELYKYDKIYSVRMYYDK